MRPDKTVAQLDTAVLEAVRASNRSCTAASLAAGGGLELAVISEALERLALRGELVRTLRPDGGPPSYRPPLCPLHQPEPVDHEPARAEEGRPARTAGPSHRGLKPDAAPIAPHPRRRP
jgi:hypothetical protein